MAPPFDIFFVPRTQGNTHEDTDAIFALIKMYLEKKKLEND
jgi:hypothetical protein